MKIAISPSAPSTIATELLVILVTDNGDKTPVARAANLRSGSPGPGLAAASPPPTSPAIRGARLAALACRSQPPSASSSSAPASRTSSVITELRKLAGAAARAAKSKNIKSFVLVLPELAGSSRRRPGRCRRHHRRRL